MKAFSFLFLFFLFPLTFAQMITIPIDLWNLTGSGGIGNLSGSGTNGQVATWTSTAGVLSGVSVPSCPAGQALTALNTCGGTGNFTSIGKNTNRIPYYVSAGIINETTYSFDGQFILSDATLSNNAIILQGNADKCMILGRGNAAVNVNATEHMRICGVANGQFATGANNVYIFESFGLTGPVMRPILFRFNNGTTPITVAQTYGTYPNVGFQFPSGLTATSTANGALVVDGGIGLRGDIIQGEGSSYGGTFKHILGNGQSGDAFTQWNRASGTGGNGSASESYRIGAGRGAGFLPGNQFTHVAQASGENNIRDIVFGNVVNGTSSAYASQIRSTLRITQTNAQRMVSIGDPFRGQANTILFLSNNFNVSHQPINIEAKTQTQGYKMNTDTNINNSIHLTNGNTGTSATDGTEFGVDSASRSFIRQRENANITFIIQNNNVMSLSSAGISVPVKLNVTAQLSYNTLVSNSPHAFLNDKIDDGTRICMKATDGNIVMQRIAFNQATQKYEPIFETGSQECQKETIKQENQQTEIKNIDNNPTEVVTTTRTYANAWTGVTTRTESFESMRRNVEEWKEGTSYSAGDLVRRSGTLEVYRVLQAHRSQSDWQPHQVPSLFVRHIYEQEITEWRQPQGSHDCYPLNAIVTYQGETWKNTGSSCNVWQPGVFGWVKQ